MREEAGCACGWAEMRWVPARAQNSAATAMITVGPARGLKLFGEVAADFALTSFFLSVAGAGVDGSETEVRLEVIGIALESLVEEFGSAFHIAGFGENAAERYLSDMEVGVTLVCVLRGLHGVSKVAFVNEGKREQSLVSPAGLMASSSRN